MREESRAYSLLYKDKRYATRYTIRELKKYFNKYAKKEDIKDLRIIKITTIIEEYDDFLRLFKEEV